MKTTSPSLLERLKRPDDPAAWERFVELYSPVLWQWVRRAGVDDPDAADLVQEVFVLLVEKLPHLAYDPQRRFRGWLWTVTKNKVRERQRRRDPIPAGARMAVEDLEAQDDGDPLADAEYRQLLVGRALQLMQTDFQPSTWQACWQSIVEGKSAAELGMTDGALRATRFRVLTRLRSELAGLWE
jgi:RNA polymerase sigma-70 factor (ECF subfamily)